MATRHWTAGLNLPQIRQRTTKMPTLIKSRWYYESRRAIIRQYGQDWRLFSALLAATSPHASVKCNLALARKAYLWHKAGILHHRGFNRTHWGNIQRAVSGLPLSGQKVSRFYQNLIGNESVVTVDIWILRHYGYTVNSPSPKLYLELESRVQVEASQAGRTPAAHQAYLWGKVRGSPESFADNLAQLSLF